MTEVKTEELEITLDHLERVLALADIMMPTLRLQSSEPNMVESAEHILRSAKTWANQKRVDLMLGSLHQKSGAEAKTKTKIEPEKEQPVPPAPEVNPLEFLGDMLKGLAPLADVLGKLGGPRR